MNKLMPIQQLKTTRSFMTSSCYLFRKNPGFDEIKVHNSDSLMENAPEWKEATATESEADIKAEKEPEVSPQVLREETAEWVRSHRDSEGNIPMH